MYGTLAKFCIYNGYGELIKTIEYQDGCQDVLDEMGEWDYQPIEQESIKDKLDDCAKSLRLQCIYDVDDFKKKLAEQEPEEIRLFLKDCGFYAEASQC